MDKLNKKLSTTENRELYFFMNIRSIHEDFFVYLL
jgi:hypothetical protein